MANNYNKQEVADLTHQYVQTQDESILARLIEAAAGIIDVQLGKHYMSMEEDWEEMKQDCLIRLWQALLNNPIQLQKSQKPDQWFWGRIRSLLHKHMHRLKNHSKGKGMDMYNKHMTSLDKLAKTDDGDENSAWKLDQALYGAEDVFDPDTIQYEDEPEESE